MLRCSWTSGKEYWLLEATGQVALRSIFGVSEPSLELGPDANQFELFFTLDSMRRPCGTILRNNIAALQQNGAQLVDQRRPLTHQPIATPVQGLHSLVDRPWKIMSIGSRAWAHA
jgi:hypothetical protein